MSARKTAGELSNIAQSDTTKYDALEVGHAMVDDIEKHLYESIALHKNIIEEPEFCVVMVLAKDPLIHNLQRRKFYCWPFLPKPRPNQSVFLYNKACDRIIKRLWCLPSDVVMAELAGTGVIVDKRYETMQAWSVAFFKGVFWDYIRYEHDITMLSEHEYVLKCREELLKSGVKLSSSDDTKPLDFSEIAVKAQEVIDSQTAVLD